MGMNLVISAVISAFDHNILAPADFLHLAGLMTCYVLFFIHLGTRKVQIGGCTYHPNSFWMAQQARNFSMMIGDNPKTPCRYLIHDNEASFNGLDTILACES